MQKFQKLVKIWQIYREFKGGNFFETLCSYKLLIVNEEEVRGQAVSQLMDYNRECWPLTTWPQPWRCAFSVLTTHHTFVAKEADDHARLLRPHPSVHQSATYDCITHQKRLHCVGHVSFTSWDVTPQIAAGLIWWQSLANSTPDRLNTDDATGIVHLQTSPVVPGWRHSTRLWTSLTKSSFCYWHGLISYHTHTQQFWR